MSKINVVLVDDQGKVLGLQEKFAAHKNPVPLHRAISVIIYDSGYKNILLQQRASGKPTWPLYWSNACCTHPFPDESYEDCAARRLKEEMGISTQLIKRFAFVYQAEYDQTWGEHEYDVVFEGVYDGPITTDPNEVADYKWVSLADLKQDMSSHPDLYTPWFKIIMEKL